MDRKQVANHALDIAEKAMQQLLADPGGAPDKLTIIPMATMMGGKDGLTPSRIALFIELRTHGAYGRMQELADAVGRDKYAVSKDVDVLAMHGLVHKHKRGRTVTIEADTRPIVLA